MSSFSLAPEVRVFPCPNCRETINTTMQQCPFCSTPINAAAAEAAAAETSHVSAAVSDASYLRIAAGVLLAFFLLRFVPLISGLCGMAYLVLTIGIPIGCIRWWVKYGAIKTTDPDYAPARSRALLITVLVGANFLLWLVLFVASIFLVRHAALNQ